MGIGYGVGIYDFPLIKKSFINLGIAAAISLFTSTLYFFVTPLSEAQSELLARKADAILTSVRLDTGWPAEFQLDEATLAPGPTAWQRADRLLAGKLFKTEGDPDLAPALRILHRKMEAPS